MVSFLKRTKYSTLSLFWGGVWGGSSGWGGEVAWLGGGTGLGWDLGGL